MQENFIVEKINLEQTAEIYKNWINRHFPPGEVKPLKLIEKLWGVGAYHAIALYKEGEKKELAGYAFFVSAPDTDWILLDYYAILEEYRDGGRGGFFLKEIRNLLSDSQGLLIETEDIDYATDEEERVTRERRDRFYERTGVIKTGVRSYVFDTRFAIWEFPRGEALSDRACRETLEKIYDVFLPKDRAAIYGAGE